MDAKLETIRNLLAKAEDAACPTPEAEALTAMAARLMAKHGIDDAMLAARRASRDRGTVADRRIQCSAPYALDKVDLLQCVAEPMGLRLIRVGAPAGSEVAHVFGFRVDLDRAELLYTSLLLQAAHAMRKAEVTDPDAARARAYRGSSGFAAWRRSFLAGFAGAVRRRIADAEREVQAEAARESTSGPSVALVIADRRSEVEQAYREAYPHIRTARRSLSGRGHDAGRAAGQRASLGGQQVAGGRRAVDAGR